MASASRGCLLQLRSPFGRPFVLGCSASRAKCPKFGGISLSEAERVKPYKEASFRFRCVLTSATICVARHNRVSISLTIVCRQCGGRVPRTLTRRPQSGTTSLEAKYREATDETDSGPCCMTASWARVSTLRPLIVAKYRPFLRHRCARISRHMGQSLSADRQQSAAFTSIVRAQNRGAVLASATDDSAKADIWLVVGLGNPGPRYAGTRHNVGFQALDEIARQCGERLTKVQSNAAVGRVEIAGARVLLAKPMTFMNNSGEAVGKLCRFYKVPPQRIVIIYDDLDIPCANVRLRVKGGHGGHNGMRSILQHLGSPDFPRIRIGIGRPPGNATVLTHVLQDFTAKEREDIDVAIQETAATLAAVLKLGVERALSGMRVAPANRT